MIDARRASIRIAGLLAAVCGLCGGDGRSSNADEPQDAVSAIRSLGADVLLITNRQGGVYRSADGAQTWSNVGGGLSNSPIYSLDVDRRSRLWVCMAAGLFISDDRGESWRPVESDGWRKMARGGRLMFLHWVDERTVLARTWVEGLYRSVDGGDTWDKIAPELARRHVMQIVTSPDATLWAATFGGGVFRSRDAGATWHAVGDGLAERAVLCVAAPADGTIWAGTYGDGVFRRQGEGLWQPVGDGLPPQSIVQTLATTDDGSLLAGTYGHGLFIRQVDGHPWRRIGDDQSPKNVTAIAIRPDRLLVGTQSDGLHEVNAVSGEWNSVPLRILVVSLARGDDGRIFAALDSGPLVVSVDQGRSWTPTAPVAWRDSAVLLSVRNALFAGTSEGLYVSHDGAVTWQVVSLPARPLDVAYLADAGEGSLFAGLTGQQAAFGLLQSSDWGATWIWAADTPRGGKPRRDSSLSEAEFNGLRAPGQAGDQFQFCLVADPVGRVVVGTDRGLYYSVDRGRTWTFHFLAYGVLHAALDRNGGLYAAGMNGLFHQTAGGAELDSVDVVDRDTLRSSYERIFTLPDGKLLANASGTDVLTYDKATTWVSRQLVEFGYGRLQCVLVVDDTTILAGGPMGLVATRDGGNTWKPIPLDMRREKR
jgi:ligand-binding sensor domain-containing protein